MIYREARELLLTKTDIYNRKIRLLGVGAGRLEASNQTSLFLEEYDHEAARMSKVERATDAIRAKLGDDLIKRGIQLDYENKVEK